MRCAHAETWCRPTPDEVMGASHCWCWPTRVTDLLSWAEVLASVCQRSPLNVSQVPFALPGRRKLEFSSVLDRSSGQAYI